MQSLIGKERTTCTVPCPGSLPLFCRYCPLLSLRQPFTPSSVSRPILKAKALLLTEDDAVYFMTGFRTDNLAVNLLSFIAQVCLAISTWRKDSPDIFIHKGYTTADGSDELCTTVHVHQPLVRASFTTRQRFQHRLRAHK